MLIKECQEQIVSWHSFLFKNVVFKTTNYLPNNNTINTNQRYNDSKKRRYIQQLKQQPIYVSLI